MINSEGGMGGGGGGGGGGGVYWLLYTLHEKWNGEFNMQEEKFFHFTLNGKQGVVAKLFFSGSYTH
jgi:hypothetical protein